MSELKLADKLWQLYKQHKSLRKVADIVGISHVTVKQYLSEAGYDTHSVNPKVNQDTISVQSRIRVEDEDLIRSLLESGDLVGTMSSQVMTAVRQYCDRIRESQKQTKCLSALAAATTSKSRPNGIPTIYNE